MEPIYIASIISFIVGALAYVIIQFWIRPILQFKKIKKKILLELETFNNATISISKGSNPDRSKLLRKYSIELSDCYNIELPHWYKLLLNSREESPIEASKCLMTLTGVNSRKDAEKHIYKIKNYMKL